VLIREHGLIVYAYHKLEFCEKCYSPLDLEFVAVALALKE